VRELFHVLERAGSPAVANSDDLSLHAAVARVEKELIQRALERAKGNRSAAARLLGIARPQLYAKLEEHGLGGPRGDGQE
jgi:DNA-binding NtrC family response regulator